MYFHRRRGVGLFRGASSFFSSVDGGPRLKLGVSRQHFTHCILKLPPRSDSAPYLFDPILGDVLDTFFPLNHKGQRPDGMAPIIGTMAGGLAATEMGEGERTGEGIRGSRKTAKQLELALAQSRSDRALAWMNHLIVYIH